MTRRHWAALVAEPALARYHWASPHAKEPYYTMIGAEPRMCVCSCERERVCVVVHACLHVGSCVCLCMCVLACLPVCLSACLPACLCVWCGRGEPESRRKCGRG